MNKFSIGVQLQGCLFILQKKRAVCLRIPMDPSHAAGPVAFRGLLHRFDGMGCGVGVQGANCGGG